MRNVIFPRFVSSLLVMALFVGCGTSVTSEPAIFDLATKEAALATKEAVLASKEASLVTREADLATKEKSLIAEVTDRPKEISHAEPLITGKWEVGSGESFPWRVGTLFEFFDDGTVTVGDKAILYSWPDSDHLKIGGDEGVVYEYSIEENQLTLKDSLDQPAILRKYEELSIEHTNLAGSWKGEPRGSTGCIDGYGIGMPQIIDFDKDGMVSLQGPQGDKIGEKIEYVANGQSTISDSKIIFSVSGTIFNRNMFGQSNPADFTENFECDAIISHFRLVLKDDQGRIALYVRADSLDITGTATKTVGLEQGEVNPYTGETQYIGISREQEVAIGLQAAPEMAQQYGGLDSNVEAQAYLDKVCQKLISNSVPAETDYPFECSLLADPETINVFSLPGGPIFITAGLFNLLQTEGQLTGVMGHEIGHIVARHSTQFIANQELTQGVTGAVAIASYDPNNPNSTSIAQMGALIDSLINMSYVRKDELESDRLGVHFMAEAGYDPRAMVKVMEILAAVGSDGGRPEFFSTHPNPENRIKEIEAAIQQEFPDGVPEGLIQ